MFGTQRKQLILKEKEKNNLKQLYLLNPGYVTRHSTKHLACVSSPKRSNVPKVENCLHFILVESGT